MVGRFSRISLGCFASDHDSINDDDREWSRSCAADEDERSLDATAPIAPIRNHNDALLEAAKVMAEHLGASILTRSSNTIDDDGISQESSGIDPVHNRASGDGTRDDSTEAFQNLSFVELLTLHGELLARREAEFQQLAQLQATAQRRSQAHAIGTLRLAQLEEIQRKMDESCQEICTISQSVAPSPDLEVRRARERQMYKLQREGGHAATFFSKRNVHPAQAPAFMINELGKKTKEAARFYDASMHNFERSWKIVAQRADGWAETPARWDWAYSRLQAEEVSGGQQERWARTEKALHDILPHPPSWLDELSRDDAKRTTATLENLLNDFESTSKKICALTGQDLSGLLTRPSTEPSAKLPAGSKEAATPASRIPLENLFHLAFVAHGSDGMLRLAKELFINAVPTLMSGGVRQSEMEKLLLAVLDVLHSSRQEVRQDSLTSHLDGLPGGGGAAATFGRSGASSSTIRWLLQPSLTLEQELLRYVKEAQQRASQRRAEIIRSLPLEAMSDDESDSADAAYSARSISASFANTMASTASSWYSSVADGFSTLQGAASGTLFAGHEGPPSETDATAPGLHSPAAAPKPSLYERSQTPTSHPSKSPLGLSSYISPASPTAAKVSSSWTAEQASRISDKSSADIDVGLASASGTPCESYTRPNALLMLTSFPSAARHDAAQSRLSNLSHISPSPGPKSHRVRKESIRVVPGLSPIRLPSTATSTAPTTVEITDAQQEEHHVREAATQLLEKLLKQPDSASPSVPIVVALARAILQDRFSAAAEPETHRHLKILILVRWWAFKHMRGMLCDLFSVSRSWSAVGYGISAMEDDFLSRDDGQHQKFMEDTWLSDPGVIEQLAALHKALYVAITDAVNAREAYSGLQEAAAQAIKAFVPLSSPRISTTPKLKTTPTPVRREKIPAAFALTYQEYAALTVPLHFGVVPKLERSVAGEATFFVQRSGPNDARLARSHRFTIAATLAARVQPSTSKTHRSPNGISWSPITAKPSSNGMTTKPQLNNLSGFSTSSGRGLSRALSGWGSPVGSPGEMSLVPVAGAGFFDVTAAPAPTHAHRNGTPSESLATAYWQKLSAPTRRDLRRGFELLALLGSSAAVPDPLTAAHIALQQVTAQQRWADTALLQWWVREVENLAAAHGKLFLVSLMRLCVSKAEEDSRIIGDATQTVSLLLARLASDWHSSILTAQRLFSSMHELRSKIWYASAIRTCAALQQAWFAAPLSHAKEDLQQWLTSTGVQDLQIGDDNFSIIVALDEGFAAIAGDAGQFFANQM